MSSLSSSLSPFSLLSFSLALRPFYRSPPLVLFLSLPLVSRSLSSFPPTRQRSRAASRTRDTDACEIPLSSCERTPVRGQDYPAPCAIAKNQFVAPATHRHRCRHRHCRCRRYSRRGVARRESLRHGSPVYNIVRPENERERGAFGNVHSYRGLKALRSEGKKEGVLVRAFSARRPRATA